jgi:hypothetical protein
MLAVLSIVPVLYAIYQLIPSPCHQLIHHFTFLDLLWPSERLFIPSLVRTLKNSPAFVMASSSSSNIITRDTFDEINSSIQASATKTLRAAGTTLPADLDFHRTLDSEYGAEVDATAARVLALTNKLLALAESSNTSSRGKGKARLQDKEDVLDRFHAVVVDAMDGMLERAVSNSSVPTRLCISLDLGHSYRSFPW